MYCSSTHLPVLDSRTNIDSFLTPYPGVTFPHYIRCIKPNQEKQADLFDSVISLQQLKYAGVMEAVMIRKGGFPFKYTHEQFFKKYRALSSDPSTPSAKQDSYKVCVQCVQCVYILAGTRGLKPHTTYQIYQICTNTCPHIYMSSFVYDNYIHTGCR